MYLDMIIVVLTIIKINYINCFNFDTKFPIIYVDPNRFGPNRFGRQSYFGYSVILFEGSKSTKPWIQIGAPRGNNSLYKFKEPGIVYRCPILQPCKLFPVDQHVTKEVSGRINKDNFRIKKDGAWIGGAMDIQPHLKRVAVCGHRLINSYRLYYMEGACYWSHTNDNDTETLLPLIAEDRIFNQIAYNARVYDLAMGQAGMSVHFPDTSGKPELLIGAPGVFNWKGTSLVYKDGAEIPSAINKRFIHAETFTDLIIPDVALSDDLYSFGYFGYAVSSGYFFNRNELLYVAGAPRSSLYKGEVFLFNMPKKSAGRLKIRQSRQGKMMGEYFGAALTVVDVNGDQLDDLIVGAPHYSSNSDEGCVYVFLGNPTGNLLKSDQSHIIKGRSPGGQFGLAVQWLGDINVDGYSDVAIGAPYEDEQHGVVYIYNGGENGLSVTPSQRIIGREISPNLKGFGISFSRPTDIDKNYFDDLAVGSYLSGYAVIIRGRPVTTLKMSVYSYMDRLDHNATHFTISTCFWYVGSHLPPTLRINRTIVIDEDWTRAYIPEKSSPSTKYTQNILLRGEIENCQNLTINIKRNIQHFLDPIAITVTQELVEKNIASNVIWVTDVITNKDNFCKLCPVVDNALSTKYAKIEVPFALDCGDDNICESDLKLHIQFLKLSNENKFVIGSKISPSLEIIVSNEGEAAYVAQLKVILPENVHLLEILPICREEQENNTMIVLCEVDNPLRKNNPKKIILNLDTSGIHNNKKVGDILEFKMIATSKSIDIVPKDNSLTLLLKLVVEANITVKGTSQKSTYFYGNNSFSNSTHIYEVQKLGASPINEVTLNVSVPVSIKTRNGLINFLQIYEPVGFQDGQPINCNWDDMYVIDETKLVYDEITDGQFSDEQSEKIETRTKRSIDSNSGKKYDDTTSIELPPTNRTVFLNCSTPDVICRDISCVIGPFRRSMNVARLQVKMIVNVTLLAESVLGIKDIICMSTDGYVKEIEGYRNDNTRVSNIFLGVPPEIRVDYWIIILSVVAGVLILMLLIMGLIKIGFFQRTKKIELQALKEAEDTENPKKPTNICFLDWQISHVGPPVLDILYFTYACTDKKLRDEHYENLLNIDYYQTLKKFGAELGTDIADKYPYDVFRAQLKKFGKYGLSVAIMLLHLMTSESEEVPDMNEIFDSGDMNVALEAFNFDSKNIVEYNIRMRDVVLHLATNGYI